MTEKKQRPTIGGINRQYATLGGSKQTEPSNVKTSENLSTETSMHPSAQEDKRQNAKEKNDRIRHTIYFTADLSKWIKHQAVDQSCDISDIVAEAVEQYRARLK